MGRRDSRVKGKDSSNEQKTLDQRSEQPLLHVFLLGHMLLVCHAYAFMTSGTM
jgi:hypothetical protein